MTVAELLGRAFRLAFARRPATESSVNAKTSDPLSHQVEHGRRAFDSSCPVGLEGRVCKHAVAVAPVVTDAVADPGQRAATWLTPRRSISSSGWDGLLIATDHEADFAPFAAKLRTTHKPKRNLMKLFDERSW